MSAFTPQRKPAPSREILSKYFTNGHHDVYKSEQRREEIKAKIVVGKPVSIFHHHVTAAKLIDAILEVKADVCTK